MRIKIGKKGQIWVETVVYTLIGLVIIGIVLAVATPAVSRYKDEIVIEQTIAALNSLNEKILETAETSGNKRIVEFRIKKGKLILDCTAEKIKYVLEESGLEYSEPGAEVRQGDIIILTEKKARKNDITLSLDYSGKEIDLTYNKNNGEKTLNQAPLPYKLNIENLGPTTEEKTQVDITESS